ncbi:MAG: DoxX family protein [Sphingopyxis sp.]|uniref:DoxX family protein n=1 Tax=Sphingopyxis sp. TaxID=1908224 RepID=UPI002ABB8151|nr:DoxX family protein [Sphingopyxis sp.]MDZ3832213.1 DoxX family protein [Sphingopyxis sp.]
MSMLTGSAAPPQRAAQSLDALRIVVALLILIHGVYRLLAGGVAPFGMWLESQGFPAGYILAMAVTLVEWVGPILILLRHYVAIAALVHIVILSLGLVLVHLPSGWFVVGAGRNGVEYSVLLIAGLAGLAWAYWPTGAAASTASA